MFPDNPATGTGKAAVWRCIKRITSAVLGGVAGYAYYYFIGCASGACPITSNPWISTAYGAVLGFLLMPLASGSQRGKKREEQGGNVSTEVD